MGVCDSTFREDRNYNKEDKVHFRLDLDKKSFYPGELITGRFIFSLKENSPIRIFTDPTAIFTLKEMYQWYFSSGGRKTTRHQNEDERILTQSKITFNQFINADLSSFITIPFSFQLPANGIHPTLHFNEKSFVAHYFTVEFPSINAKKSEIIAIKNTIYYTLDNYLYRSPATAQLNTDKHRGFANKGNLSCTLTLPKNVFSYSEQIPFTIDLNISHLDMEVGSLLVTLKAIGKYNDDEDNSKVVGEKIIKINEKRFPIDKSQKIIKLTDSLCIPIDSKYFLPKIYKLIDADKDDNPDNNLQGKIIAQPSYYGLLSCQYEVNLKIEMNTTFTTDEEFSIPIDLYEPYP